MSNNHTRHPTSGFCCSAMLLAALTAGAWSVTAVAGDHGDRKDHDAQTMDDKMFQRSDTDRDGSLSRDEYDMMRTKERASASRERMGEGLPATAHQSEAVRSLDGHDSDHDGDMGARGLNDAQTTRSTDSSHSGMSQQHDSSRSPLSDRSDSSHSTMPAQRDSSHSTMPGQSGYSGANSYGQ